MGSERDAVKAKIVEATIACIEKGGISSVTARSVAKEAGVNVASINYYFGTKENLLEETFKTTLEHFSFDMHDLLSLTELHSHSLLKVFFSFLMEGIQHYPRLVQALIFNEKIAPKYRNTFLRHFSSTIEVLVGRILQENPMCTPQEATTRVLQMLYAVLSTGLPFQIGSLVGCDLGNAEQREYYLDLLLSRYIDWIPPERIEAQRNLVKEQIRKLFESRYAEHA